MSTPGFPRRCGAGFTLTELVMVIVLLAIIAGASVSWISLSTRGYVDTARRQQLTSAGLVMLEQMAREFSAALPNSIRITADGRCAEYVPILAGSRYRDIPLAAPADSFTGIAPSDSSVTEGYVSVYPQVTDEIYSSSLPGLRTPDMATLSSVGGNDEITVTFASPYQFLTGSPGKRFYLTGAPLCWCLQGTRLVRYDQYGFRNQLSGPPAGGNRTIMGDMLRAGTGLYFSLLDASFQRGSLLSVRLRLVDPAADEEVVDLSREIQVRNVP